MIFSSIIFNFIWKNVLNIKRSITAFINQNPFLSPHLPFQEKKYLQKAFRHLLLIKIDIGIDAWVKVRIQTIQYHRKQQTEPRNQDHVLSPEKIVRDMLIVSRCWEYGLENLHFWYAENDREAVRKYISCKKDCNNVYVVEAKHLKREESKTIPSNNCLT